MGNRILGMSELRYYLHHLPKCEMLSYDCIARTLWVKRALDRRKESDFRDCLRIIQSWRKFLFERAMKKEGSVYGEYSAMWHTAGSIREALVALSQSPLNDMALLVCEASEQR